MDLKTFAKDALTLASVISGSAPVINTIFDLGNALKAVGHDMTELPKNEDGSPMTLEQVQVHLKFATDASTRQDDAIRDQAAAILAENAAAGQPPAGQPPATVPAAPPAGQPPATVPVAPPAGAPEPKK